MPAPGETSAVSTVDNSVLVQALLSFGREIIDTVAPIVPAIKINIAFFERLHAAGVSAYFVLIRHAHQAGLIVIGDAKRADIGHTSTQYAIGHLSDSGCDPTTVADAVTVNPYFGYDSVRPFIDTARETGRGVFVLVQTSNKSAKEVQGLALSDGSLVCERVAELVQGWASAEGLVGSSGYSSVGAVVSPRDLESTQRIRASMPNCIFLVPGFGAQGRTSDEIAKCFRPDGTGAIVNASRSIIYGYEDDRYKDRFKDNWQRAVEQACLDCVAAVRTVLPR